ncbi:signal transduction histidine kinase [Xenococcus sp. PCC 7305]|uniref:sensor histidine kinase n=1 Tax=Xenococcus sp. PCC 7305 TaxID=102125 RepID=UPI0002AC81DD|nr:sensor histidine kinase [Xenococcus sp. PCC 7305]ELS04163.1 signal transduction histidine kinase [Xenococcus sp. PCC 7305]
MTKHPFRLLLYVEWVLLGIALLSTLSFVIPNSRHHLVSHPPLFNLGAILGIVALGIMGLKLPFNSNKIIKVVYITVGLGLSWLVALLVGRGERVFPALLLIVVIRACLLFPWRGRIFVAVVAYFSFFSIQIMSLMRFNPLGIGLTRPLPRFLRRLPPEELQRVLFSFAFNSALLFAFVLAFVLLLVGAVLAEHDSRNKLVTAHRRLRDYALQIENQAILQERNRIAREIHDSVGHYLTAQSIQLENTALFLMQEPEKADNHLAKARKLGKEALENIRASVATLRKNPLQERSLETILERLITDFKLNTDITITSKFELVNPLATEVTTAFYRIVQEAFTNITKHSNATIVELDLQETAVKIQLSIKDNGCGFNPTENTTGFGLQGMQERTEALNGNFMVISEYGKGCQIVVNIPLSLNDDSSPQPL